MLSSDSKVGGQLCHHAGNLCNVTLRTHGPVGSLAHYGLTPMPTSTYLETSEVIHNSLCGNMLRINRKIKDRLKKFLQVFFVPQRIEDSSFESGRTFSVDFLSLLVWYNRVVESSRGSLGGKFRHT